MHVPVVAPAKRSVTTRRSRDSSQEFIDALRERAFQDMGVTVLEIIKELRDECVVFGAPVRYEIDPEAYIRFGPPYTKDVEEVITIPVLYIESSYENLMMYVGGDINGD